MADIPLFPDESNMARFQDFVNIQKEISEHLLAQKHLYADIGRINRDVEDRLIKRRVKELDMLNLIQKQNVKYNELVAKRGTLSGQAAKDLENDIDATLQLIEYNRKLIDLSKLASSVEVEMAKKRYEEDHKYFNFASTQAKKLLGLKVNEVDLTASMGEELIKLGVRGELLANTFGAIIMMLKGGYDLFNKMDKAAWDFRKAMGMTRLEAATIRKDVQRIAIDNMAMGVTVESVYKSYQELGKVVGGVHNVTKSMAEDVSLMSAQLGVSEVTSAGFLRNMSAISKNSMESQTNMMYVASSMSAAAGVGLEDVMKSVASRSTQTLTMMSRVPNIALRSAIELKRMGSSLDQAARSSRHILDFTENVNEEMEASVLLGRSINLQRARELAYNRDLEGSTKEILRISKSVNFEKLDVFQQEAFAKATGKSVDELLNMLQTSRQLERVQRAGTPEQKAQLALYEKMRNENEKAAKARAKDASLMLRTMNNQTRLAAISAKWNALLAKAQEFLLPIVDKMLELVLPAMDITMAIAKWSFVLGAPLAMMFTMGKTMYTIGHGMNMMLTTGFKLSRFFAGMANLGLKLMGPWNRISALVGMVLGKLGFFGKFLGFFGKLLGPIGWVITAFQAIGGFIKGWNSTTGNWIQKLGGGLMGALRNIIPGFDYIVKAVKWIGGWIWKIVTFSFKWLTLPGLLIQAYKGLKNMFPETFAAIGNLLGKVWGVFTKILGVGWQIAKMLFGAWWSGVKLIWSGVKMIWNAFAEPIAAVWGMVKSFFGLMGAYWKAYVSGPISKFFGSFSGGLDHMLASIINGFTSLAGSIWHALTDPFKRAWGWVKGLWGGSSPSQVGLSILNGIMSIGPMIFNALTAPFRKGMAWIIDKVPGMGKMAEKLRGGMSSSVEKKATAAYIPAVNVTPKGTEVAPFTRKPGEKGKDEKESNQPMSEATGQKICSLLEKILAKDNNIHMDGQLLSSHLARQTEFRGGYGVNKVA